MSSETVELSERVELSSDAAVLSLEVSAAPDSSTAEETEAVLFAASPPSPGRNPILGDAEGLGVLFGEDGFAESRCFHQGGLGEVLLGGDAPGEHLLPQAAVDAGHRNAGGLVIPQQQTAQVGHIVFCHVKKGLHGLLAAPAGFIGQIHGRFPAFLGIS